ncbi:MAG: phosphoribosylformylglycinamidine synthase subunit PurS [Actinomycetota bacterium]|nr:phosphoribosylformylglycinamidine synthase subunit PurS [Actinomycetota bacterium]
MTFEAVVEVRLKAGVADPEGATIHVALCQLGMEQVREVHGGRMFRLSIDADDPETARRIATTAASGLLANPVLEDYTVEVSDRSSGGVAAEHGVVPQIRP